MSHIQDSQIYKQKKKLFEILNEDPFHEFNDWEDLLLHSKHGILDIYYKDGSNFKGITPAFGVGISCTIGDFITIPIIDKIDWRDKKFWAEDIEYNFNFESEKFIDL